MKKINVLSRTIFLSFIMALAAYAEEGQQHLGRPTAEMRAEFEKKIATLKVTCETDINTLCADAEGPHVIGCLKENSSSLSVEVCQQAVAALPERPLHQRPPRR